MLTRAYAPASIGNFLAGFDVLGCALERLDGQPFGDSVTVGDSAENSFSVGGVFAGALPEDSRDNLVCTCLRLFNAELSRKGVREEPVSIHLEKRLPVCSGLGSSSSSIVACLVALNGHYGGALEEARLLGLCASAEGRAAGSLHYDNVAPSLLGGLRLMAPGGAALRLPLPPNWRFAVCHPGGQVATCFAREVLPSSYPRVLLVEHAGRLASLVAALLAGDENLAAKCLVDAIAEPYRKGLVPKYEALASLASREGALAFGLSGSGPACFALCDGDEAAYALAHKMKEVCADSTGAFACACKADTVGARTERDFSVDKVSVYGEAVR